MLADEFGSKKFPQFFFEKDKCLVHIRNKQRNGKKSFTMVEGLATDLDVVKILKCLRKMLATNGTLLKDENNQVVLQLQGLFFFEILFLLNYFSQVISVPRLRFFWNRIASATKIKFVCTEFKKKINKYFFRQKKNVVS